jgi:hypothetical protein
MEIIIGLIIMGIMGIIRECIRDMIYVEVSK